MALAPQQERLAWVDTARGIGIILVVYGHALRGHETSGAFDPSWQADVQDAVIYSFHMPLFFFLAGLFAKRSVAKGATLFLRDKAVTLVYPYFLWSVVSILLGMTAALAVNNAHQSTAIFNLWRTPVYQYWFLYALLICQVVALMTTADWRITAGLCLLSAVFGGGSALGMITIAFGFYLYFGLGVLLAPRLADLHFRRVILISAVLLMSFMFAATYLIDHALPTRLIAIARASLGGAAVIALAMLCAPHARWLTIIGTASMAIYVLHTIFSSGLRMALHAAGYSDNLVALILGTFAGLAGPMVVWAIARHYGVLPWFGLGAQPRLQQERAI